MDSIDSATDREREVASVISHIDKLDGAGLRAVLRNLATDDAVFSEAQCSHMARVVDGTLHEMPREAVNAMLSCASGPAAAANWEKQFATYPHHPGLVSALVSALVLSTEGGDPGPVQTDELPAEQPHELGVRDIEDGEAEAVNLLGAGDATNDSSLPSIINKGHMTIHFHYRSASSDASRKREREEEDEHYAQALDAVMSTDQPSADALSSTRPMKRARLQQAKAKKGEKAHPVTKADKIPPVQNVRPYTHLGKICRNCGARFTRAQNVPREDGELPCRHHTGGLAPYPAGLRRERSFGTEMLFEIWDCCGGDPDDVGCAYTRHVAE